MTVVEELSLRQPILMAVCGKKGVGKSYTTMIYLRDYVRNSPRRKVLIFDVNNEYANKKKYPDVMRIGMKDLYAYSKSRTPRICRIAPFFDDGTPMTLDDMARVLQWIVRNYFNGLLLIEDINKYVGDHMPGDLIGAICTNRHAGVDIILHYQSVGRLTTKVWQNITCLRMHRNTESVDRHKNKFDDKWEYLKIAEIIVKKQFKLNKHYYLFVDFDEEKVHAELPEEVIKDAITDFISQNYNSVINEFANKRDNMGAKVNTMENSFLMAKEELYQQYFCEN